MTTLNMMATTSIQPHAHTPLQTINLDNHFMRAYRASTSGKSKTAVELLQESKCLYVKSETVLDHQQSLSTSPESPHYSLVKARGVPAKPGSAQLRRSYNSSSSSKDQLQAKLRKLLNSDSKENLVEDGDGCKEAKRSPQQYRRSQSQRQPKPVRPDVSQTHHKSLPDLHAAAGHDTSSDSSEPVSCEYQLYSNTRKTSSATPQADDNRSAKSSASSRFKQSLTHFSTGSSSRDSYAKLKIPPASPVKSSISCGPSYSISDTRQTEILWNVLDEVDAGEGLRLRPILRSKSDIGHRYAKLVPAPEAPANLDTFFEQLGLDSNEFSLLTKSRSHRSSPVFFSDSSSIDSSSSLTAHHAAGGSEESERAGAAELPSIVERNARIIKWLCNCRKAQLTS